ncbi:MAG: fatty acid desaturase [Pyrinomonadaceae bacterium]|nr:fatty acid desaturase [Pyrinomonadaceae bacterium]
MQNIIEFKKSKARINWRDLGIIVSFHLLLIPAFFYFSLENVAIMLIGNWVVGSLGVGLGYHRLLTHRSFQAPKWLEYALTVFASMALQSEAYKWVATHRIHHQFTETEKDPHSTRTGFWWAHIGWIFKGTAQDHDEATMKKYVPDLLKDKGQRIIARLFYVPIIVSAIILFLLGGWGFVLWGVVVRTIFGWHTTWFVNSLAHLYGKRRYETADDSTNNWFVAVLTFGEGWHNNHHAFPTSARHGFAWYEFDQNWIAIQIFKKLGWAKQIRLYNDEKQSVKLKKAA